MSVSREDVRSSYAAAARAVTERATEATDPNAGGCCGGEGGCGPSPEQAAFGGALYGTSDTESLPDEAVLASLGCALAAAFVLMAVLRQSTLIGLGGAGKTALAQKFVEWVQANDPPEGLFDL